ncbi:hypothetical protein [uncultured Gemmiger sp.]|uniref:hypothetical protein n=1 Tax=uncultured Gemmiger sp. TaxID=1623490 RepID=UPI0025DE8125|nr:hypothetical protein [uncultured Gemmiger sp.]
MKTSLSGGQDPLPDAGSILAGKCFRPVCVLFENCEFPLPLIVENPAWIVKPAGFAQEGNQTWLKCTNTNVKIVQITH